MKPLAFRITNFRSIVDSGWIPFSPDGVTVLVGQNESGKTSILDALARAMSDTQVSEDDCRINAPLPKIYLRVDVPIGRIQESISKYSRQDIEAVKEYLSRIDNKVVLVMEWDKKVTGAEVEYTATVEVDDADLDEALSRALVVPDEVKASTTETAAATVTAETVVTWSNRLVHPS